MRIKVKGRIKLKEIHQVSEKVIEYLSRYRITETGEEALIVDSKTGEEIDTIIIDNPTKKTGKRKSSSIKAVNNNNK